MGRILFWICAASALIMAGSGPSLPAGWLETEARAFVERGLTAAALEMAGRPARLSTPLAPPGARNAWEGFRPRVMIIPGPAGTPDLAAVAVTLPPDEGRIVFFSSDGSSAFRRRSVAGGLSRIDRVELWPVVDGDPYPLLAAVDVYDERFGAFHAVSRLSLYRWSASAWTPVWRGVLWSESYALSPPLAWRQEVLAEVRWAGGRLEREGTERFYVREPSGHYRLVDEKAFTERFAWQAPQGFVPIAGPSAG